MLSGMLLGYQALGVCMSGIDRTRICQGRVECVSIRKGYGVSIAATEE